jgi:hypothetical protein
MPRIPCQPRRGPSPVEGPEMRVQSVRVLVSLALATAVSLLASAVALAGGGVGPYPK